MEIKLTQNPQQKPDLDSELGFGQHFSDHIIYIEYKKASTVKSKPLADPLTRTIVMSAIIVFIILVMDTVEILEGNWSQEHWWVFPLIIIVIFCSFCNLRNI